MAAAGALDDDAGEVAAISPIDPGGAGNEPAIGCVLLEQLFAEEFGSAVGGEGIGGVVGAVWAGGFAVENEVGADVNEIRAELAAEFGEIANGVAVDGVGFVFFGFGQVYLCVSGAVQQKRWFVFFEG